uniref:HAD family hydrolase n=1 Tax=Catenibacterium sp. TaxID=2049022 RepID=UPI003AB227B0
MLQEYFRSFECDYKAVVRPQIYPVLEHLSKHYKIALASSSSLSTINTALNQAGLRKYFSLIVSGDQFKESKPNPEIYLYTIKELNVNKDEAIIIEDSSKGILAANRAGIKVLALKDDKFGLDQSQADIIIDELNDIIKLIEKGA